MQYLPATRRILAACTLFLAGALSASAQSTITATDVPRTISYQGLLSSTDGTPFADGEYGITITLYGDANGRTPIWNDSYRTQVNDGLFNLYLGEGKPLPGAEAMNRPLWIGTSVNGAPEMRPLTPLAASPYAFNVPDKAITGNKIADGTITAEKLAIEYVGEVQVDGQKVSAKGAALNLVGTPSVPLTYNEETQSLTIGRLPAQTGDREKGAKVQALPEEVWSTAGDGWDAVLGVAYTPVAGDWLGTSTAVDLEFRVNNIQAMLYQQTGTGVPNVIGGDVGNAITAATSQGSIIAEGRGQSISNGDFQTISGGENNAINNGRHNVVGGGNTNVITESEFSAIGGGDINSIGTADIAVHHSVISGGWGNMITGSEASIAGGHNNAVESYASGILGGHDNRINIGSDFSSLGGGQNNRITGSHNTIGGGTNNQINGTMSTIGGGGDHMINAPEATIAGGHNNQIHSYASGITSGHDNRIWSGEVAFIGAGRANEIHADQSAIAGGMHNMIHEVTSFIGGGHNNMISGPSAVIGGGGNNNATNPYSTIGGGTTNTTGGPYTTVGGGQENSTGGSHSTIPGGDRLSTVDSYAQVAVGFYNAPRGAVPVRPNSGTIAATNDPLFMVGNGDINAGAQSNAFEVSYNGHSTVYGVNNSGTVNAAITGATYVDNVVYAWGEIDATGGINADFGVASVVSGGPGFYTVTLNTTDPLGNPINLTQASITVTIVDDNGRTQCALATASRIGVPGPNSFDVRTYVVNGECQQTDLPFMFKVTGRP